MSMKIKITLNEEDLTILIKKHFKGTYKECDLTGFVFLFDYNNEVKCSFEVSEKFLKDNKNNNIRKVKTLKDD